MRNKNISIAITHIPMSEMDQNHQQTTMIERQDIKEAVSLELSREANELASDANILAIDANNYSNSSNKLAISSIIIAVIALMVAMVALIY